VRYNFHYLRKKVRAALRGITPFRCPAVEEPPPLYPLDLPKTGQTTSYATGDDGDLQMGVDWPAERFIDNGDNTITDTLKECPRSWG